MDKKIPPFSVKEILTRGQGDFGEYLYTYDPKSFWEEFGEDYHHTFSPQGSEDNPIDLNVKWLAARIKFLNPKSILEVGCGFGRVLGYLSLGKEIIGHERLVGVDFSESMVKSSKVFFEAEKSIKKEDYPEIIQADATDLPFQDNEFDLVYTHVCLTHIPPKKVMLAREEISRVAKNYILLMERWAYPYEHPDPHRWSHDNISHFLQMGWNVYESAKVNKKHDTILTLFTREFYG